MSKRLISLFFAIICLTRSVMAGSATNDRLSGLGMLVFSGKHAEARPQLEAALQQYRSESNATGEGVTLVLLGISDVAEEKTGAARRRLDEAAVKLREGGDGFSAFLAYWMIAHLETSEGKLDASIVQHERALAALEELSSSGAPFTLDGLMLLGPAVGIDIGPLGSLGVGADLVKPFILNMGAAMVRDSFGHVLTEAGKLPEAERQLKLAADAAQMFGGIFDTSIEAHYGDLRRRQWRFDEAQQHYRRALDSIKPLPMITGRDEWLRVSSYNQLAGIELLRGRTEEALAWNDKALALVRSGNRARESWVLDERGDLLMSSSRFDEAEKTYKEAVAAAEREKNVFRKGAALSSLGALYLFRGDYGTAARTLEKAVGLFQQSKSRENEAAAWMLLGEIYTTLNVHDAARESIENARVLAQASDFRPAKELIEAVGAMNQLIAGGGSREAVLSHFGAWWALPETGDFMLPDEVRLLIRDIVGLDSGGELHGPDPEKIRAAPLPNLTAMAYMVRGKKLLQQGDVAGARALWMKASEENLNKDLRGAYLAAIGATYWAQGKRDEGVRYFEQAVQALGVALDDVKAEDLLAGYLGSNRRWYFEIAVEALVRQGRFEDAFDHSERGRARAFLTSIGNARLRPTTGAEPELVREAEVLRKRIAEWEHDAAFDGAATVGDLNNARQRYQSLLKRIKASNPEYASLTTVEPIGAADVQRELPSGTTLISFYVAAGHVHSWIIDGTHLEYVALPVDAALLARAACWAAQLGGGFEEARSMAPEGADCDESSTAEELYQALFAPLRGKIRGDRLILMPHGKLHYVPFVALRDPRTHRRLIEDYTVTYAPSASALRFLRAKETPVNGGVLVVGDPSAASSALPRLSGAKREASTIARAFGTTPKTGAQATESLLYELGGKYDLVHIAAHAEYNADLPIFSRVALAKDGRFNGNLEVHEILAGVDLSGVNLVVLSACGTARGARSGGDEIVGLTRAVMYAGAPGVISTLWDIDDDASADLMEDFYARLREGASAADALRQAQLGMLRRAPYTDPRFWAAFSLSGNPAGRWAPAAAAR